MQRSTRQRELIWEVIQRAQRPLDPAEILVRAKRQRSTLGIATVYRTIKTLLQDGLIAPVEIPGRAPFYEKSNLHHHHHFYCLACEKVFEMEGCPGPLADLAPDGFQVEHHEIILSGTCRDCGDL